MSTLRRALDPAGTPRWLRVSGATFQDLTAAGLADDLAEVAGVLADPERWAALVQAAPEATASTWPLLLPGRPGKALCIG